MTPEQREAIRATNVGLLVFQLWEMQAELSGRMGGGPNGAGCHAVHEVFGENGMGPEFIDGVRQPATSEVRCSKPAGHADAHECNGIVWADQEATTAE